MYPVTTQLCFGVFCLLVMKAAVASCPLKATEEEEVYEISVNAAVVFFIPFIRTMEHFMTFITSFYVKRCSKSVRGCCLT